jgi:2-phospho-L-lactate guanylyltransferase
MVVHGDLPLLTGTELGTFIEAHRAGGSRALSLAPDRHHQGTNLMAWDPRQQFTPAYGAGSFRRHLRSAVQLGLAPIVCELAGAGFDIDDAADYACAIEMIPGLAPATRRVLAERAAFIVSEAGA